MPKAGAPARAGRVPGRGCGHRGGLRRIGRVAGLSAALLAAIPAAAFELSIDITHPPGEPYEEALALARAAGASTTSLSLFWDDLEQREGRYSPATDWPAIANAYYPSEGMALTVTFSVIDTLADRRPAWHRDRAWDDPDLIAAFGRHLDAVLGRLAETDLASVSIGNEVDGYLSSDAQIARFAAFFAAARQRVEAWRPGLPVGTKLSFASLVQDPARWRPLLDRASGLHLTYYPLDAGFAIPPDRDVAADVRAMVDLSGGLPVSILEAGYPSEGCGAAPDGQRQFVERLFAAAAAADRVALVSLTWLTDITGAEVAAYKGYFGIDDPCFARFLASLGLRRADGTGKPALEWLLELP